MAEERPSLQELELLIKEQELKLKVAEIRAKERDIATSKWLNPIVIGLFVATLGLVGNIVVTVVNNKNTQQIEHSRTQSTLVLEAIKTNGDTSVACKNLVFFVSLGLLEDANRTITGACPGNVQGVATLSSGPPDLTERGLEFPLHIQTVDDHNAPLSNVTVEFGIIPPEDSFPTRPCTSDKNGNCYLGMVPSGKFIALLKNLGSR